MHIWTHKYTRLVTGSNNSSRYFEYYFRKVPHVLRKNRSSLAVLSGNESEEELKGFDPEWTILNAPGFLADPAVDGTRQSNFAILSFTEIKKSSPVL